MRVCTFACVRVRGRRVLYNYTICRFSQICLVFFSGPAVEHQALFTVNQKSVRFLSRGAYKHFIWQSVLCFAISNRYIANTAKVISNKITQAIITNNPSDFCSRNVPVLCSLRGVNALSSRRAAVAMAIQYSSCPPESDTFSRLLLPPPSPRHSRSEQREVSLRRTRARGRFGPSWTGDSGWFQTGPSNRCIRFPATHNSWEFILYINGVYF